MAFMVDGRQFTLELMGVRNRTDGTGEVYGINCNSISVPYDTIAANGVKPILCGRIELHTVLRCNFGVDTVE
jgi:hypothetical protein